MRTSKAQSGRTGFPWRLLGIHSSRLDVDTRELSVDEALGLNCVWFADVIPALVSQGRATENPDIMER